MNNKLYYCNIIHYLATIGTVQKKPMHSITVMCDFIKLQQNCREILNLCHMHRFRIMSHAFIPLYLPQKCTKKIPFQHRWVCAYVCVCRVIVSLTNTPGTVLIIFTVVNGVSSCPWQRDAAGLSSEDIFRNTLLLSNWPSWKTMRNTHAYLHYLHHICI